MRTDLECANVLRYDLRKFANVFMGDRLTVGKTIAAFSQAFQSTALQIASGFSRLFSAVCNAPPHLPEKPVVGQSEIGPV